MNGHEPFLFFSAPDSARFGLRVFRGRGERVDERKLFQEIVATDADLIIVRSPAGASSAMNRLARYGLHPIHADTLVYYGMSLADHESPPLRNTDLCFSEATDQDMDALQLLVARTFEGYVSHYHANPLLDREKILAGYAEWACGYLASEQPGRITWVAKRNDTLVAFACCSHDAVGDDCEGVLYGVDPAHSGGGLYGDLIRFTQAQFRARGFRRMNVSTQVWNLAVQKVWAREGFFLCKAWDTYHINAMLSAGEPMVAREVRYSADQIERFAAVTGDRNPIHLDAAVARVSGFDDCIAHGMLTAAELSRIFGTEVPGPGTLFTRCELAFVAPVYADRAYRLEVRALAPSPWHGYVPAVATLRSGDGTLCLLAYSDLLRRS